MPEELGNGIRGMTNNRQRARKNKKISKGESRGKGLGVTTTSQNFTAKPGRGKGEKNDKTVQRKGSRARKRQRRSEETLVGGSKRGKPDGVENA